MNFALALETKLREIDRMKEVKCMVERSEGEFLGYELTGIYKGREKKQVYAGLIIRNGGIIGYGYYAGDELHKKEFLHEKFLDELDSVLTELVLDVSQDNTIGCKAWVDIMFAGETEASIRGYADVCNEHTNNKIFKFDSVLVDVGFTKVFSMAFFGWANEQFVIALVSSRAFYDKGMKVCYKSDFEARFDNKVEANAMFRRIQGSEFVSKRGNRIYRLERDDFVENFHRVHGPEFILEKNRG
jgi:hypothetical protein